MTGCCSCKRRYSCGIGGCHRTECISRCLTASRCACCMSSRCLLGCIRCIGCRCQIRICSCFCSCSCDRCCLHGCCGGFRCIERNCNVMTEHRHIIILAFTVIMEKMYPADCIPQQFLYPEPLRYSPETEDQKDVRFQKHCHYDSTKQQPDLPYPYCR